MTTKNAVRPWPGNIIEYAITRDADDVEGVIVWASRREALLLAAPEFAEQIRDKFESAYPGPLWAFIAPGRQAVLIGGWTLDGDDSMPLWWQACYSCAFVSACHLPDEAFIHEK